MDRTASCLFLGLPDHPSTNHNKISRLLFAFLNGAKEKGWPNRFFFYEWYPLLQHRLFKRTTSWPHTPISAPPPSTLLPEKRNQAFVWSPPYQQTTKQKHVDKHPILLPFHPDYSTYYTPFPPEPKFLTITNHPEKRKKENSSIFRGGGGYGEGRSKHKRVAKKKGEPEISSFALHYPCTPQTSISLSPRNKPNQGGRKRRGKKRPNSPLRPFLLPGREREKNKSPGFFFSLLFPVFFFQKRFWMRGFFLFSF